MTTEAEAINAAEGFNERGYALFPNVLSHERIDELLSNFMSLVREQSGRDFDDPHGPELVEYFEAHPEVESRVYDAMRGPDWLHEFSLHTEIVEPVRAILGTEVELLGKIPFRIDLPRSVQELAFWHQDYFYVRGNTSIVTAWVPMQSTRFLQGALTVMPGSHLLGAVPHELKIGKRDVPIGVYDREIRMVEMDKGDLLLFDSLLLHSGNLNMSESVRYSIQARYTPAGGPVDPGMGGSLPVSGGSA